MEEFSVIFCSSKKYKSTICLLLTLIPSYILLSQKVQVLQSCRKLNLSAHLKQAIKTPTNVTVQSFMVCLIIIIYVQFKIDYFI